MLYTTPNNWTIYGFAVLGREVVCLWGVGSDLDEEFNVCRIATLMPSVTALDLVVFLILVVPVLVTLLLGVL